MAKAAEPALAPDQIVFELERFERADNRLALTGRWFGVRGRRFVRPTLTLALEGERTRALADLDDKPWAAEEGEPWQASFPWAKSGRVEAPELSVASDITIQLPLPGARRVRPQRLTAQPRRELMTASWSTLGVEAPPLEAPPEPDAPELTVTPEPEAPEPDFGALRAEVERLREQLAEAEGRSASAGAELESARAELSSLRDQLERAQGELGGRGGELEALRAELSATRSAREVALRNAAQAEAEREDALTRAAEAESERDALAAQEAELAVALEQSRSELGQLTRQRDDDATARGAALVMRRATQALPAYEPHVGWLRRAVAVVVLLGIVFAVLIVLGAL